jgi:hypothetical protein
MKIKKPKYEKGQTLVVFVLGFFAFVALLALVLDGGNAYAAKRQAQNAADAGALAGATYMCRYTDEAGGISTAEDYAVLNGAVDPPQVFASLSTGTVEVTATVQKDTFFAALIGYPQVTPRAVARAVCKTPVGMGVLPVAWACRSTVVGGVIVPGMDCAQLTIDDCNGDPYDLNCTYILMDSVKVKENNKGGKCNPDQTDPTQPDYCYEQKDLVCSGHLDAPTCEAVEAGKTDCDLNNDCIDELMTGGARSWLDLDGGGGGANELTDWIKNGFPDPIPPHKWIPEESGVATSIFHTAAAYVVGEDVILPVFNNICNGYPDISVPVEMGDQCTYGPDDNRTIAGPSMNFHIITFAEFHVTCVQTGNKKVDHETDYIHYDLNGNVDPHGKDCNGHLYAVNNCVGTGNNKTCSIDENDKTIEGYFKEVDLGGYGGPGDWFNTGAFTVILVK